MALFNIRRLKEADFKQFRDIRLDALKLHPEAFGADYQDWQLKPDAFFINLLQNNFILGGFDNQGALQGILGIDFNTSAKICHIATFWGVYVSAQMRGSGLSKALVNKGIEEARVVKTIQLTVVAQNPTAIALYRACGFKAWAVNIAALYVDGVYYDEILMRLDFELTSQ